MSLPVCTFRLPRYARQASIRLLSSSSDPSDVFERSVYVHPLSQIILEYFQESRHDWICQRGLDSSLRVLRDGSFEIKDDKRRIWTSYDEEKKVHWLTLESPSGRNQFELQNNLRSPWHTSRRSLPERIHASVEELIAIVESEKET